MKNWIIRKNGDGRLAGYIQQEADVLRCKMPEEQAREAVLLLEYTDAVIEEKAVVLDGREMVWRENRRLAAAYVIDGCTLLFDTGKKPTLPIQCRMIQEQNDRMAFVQHHDEYDSAKMGAKKTDKPMDTQTDRNWPESRWPPPPCRPNARYFDGRWHERE